VVLIVAVGLAVALAASGVARTPSRLAPLSTLGKLASPGPLGPPGPEGPPLERGAPLASAGAPPPGGTVDGIRCQGREQILFHVHARLTVFVDGRQRSIPPGVGIADPQAEATPRGPFVVAGACFAWLHTHAADGIVHIESPVQRTYTLGDLFDVWGQPLGQARVGPVKGRVIALFDGKVWRGDPRTIPLYPHAQIQLEVGAPRVAPVRITNWYGL
jgi:hypothetical protein